MFFILALFLSIAHATPGVPVYTSNSLANTFLPLNVQNQCYIVTGTVDPSSSATNGPECSMYMSTNGNLYVKQDGGTSTNWSQLLFGISGVLPISKGGTGQVTANAALNALLPSQSTNSGKFLTTDGTNTSWATASGGSGANTTLSNLTSPTAVNQDLNMAGTKTLILPNNVALRALDNGATARNIISIDAFNRTNIFGVGGGNILFNNNMIPATPDTYSIGVVGDPVLDVVSDKFEVGQSGVTIGELDYTSTSPSGVGTGLSVRTNDAARNLFLFTQNSAIVDANPTRDILIETGNKTAGTGNSGNIKYSVGTSSGGAIGNHIFNSNVLPSVDDVVNVGSASKRWLLGYFDRLNDASDVAQIDLTNRTLTDSTSASSVDWAGRFLLDSPGFSSIDWGGRVLQDPTALTSVDWANRHLASDGSINTVDWENSQLNSSVGGSTSLDWQNRELFDEAGNSAIFYTAASRYLNDTAGNISMDYGARFLADAAGNIVFDWSVTGKLTTVGKLINSLGGTAPTISSCGVSPFISGTSTDTSGLVIAGSGLVTTCVVTFASVWPSTPHCFINVRGITGLIAAANPSTTDVTFNFSATAAGDTVDYFCIGN